MEYTNCIICNSSDNVLFKEFSNNKFILVKCKCDLVYLNPRPDTNEITEYYNDDYSPHKMHGGFMSNIFKKISFNWKYNIIKKLLKVKGKHLDVGAGNSNFCTFLNSKGWKSSSYDKYCNSDIVDLESIKKNSLDLITMWHSIEHIHEINDILITLRSKLKKNGYLMIACPNIAAYDRNLFMNNWIAYDIPRHLYHFNVITLSRFMNNCNYSVERNIPMIQDTFFNIYLSFDNLISKVFLFIPYILISLTKMLIFKNITSSYLYICRKNI